MKGKKHVYLLMKQVYVNKQNYLINKTNISSQNKIIRTANHRIDAILVGYNLIVIRTPSRCLRHIHR